MTRFKMAAAVAALLLGLSAVLAQEPAAEVEVDPFVGLTVGDPVAVRVTITHAPGDAIAMDASLVEMGAMEPSAPLITEVNETQTLVVFHTRAFTTGSFEVDLPSIPIRRADGGLDAVTLDPVLISVVSVLTGDAQARPNTAPDLLESEGRSFTPWIVAIIGIGLGFVAARVARQWTRRSTVPASEPAAVSGPGPAVSFEMDGSLEAAEQCRRLATSVRARLGRDWSLPATALTASEIGPALSAAGAPGVVALRATRLLEACDRVQFGGERPTPERLQGYLQLAEAIWEDGPSS